MESWLQQAKRVINMVSGDDAHKDAQVFALIAVAEQLGALTEQAKRIADVLEAHYQPNGWITVAGRHTKDAERKVTIS